MELTFKSKYAIVTGGSHGIGKTIALALANEGCNVAICARNKKNLEIVSKKIREKGVEALAIQADVLKPNDIEKCMKKVIEEWGTVDILINNVGGGGRWGSENVEETDIDVWIDVYNKNVTAAVRFTRLAIPYMRKKKWGRVVTISSICGREVDGRPWFIVAKHAEVALMKSLARTKYLARDGITFNSICPGAIKISGSGWDLVKKKNPKKIKKMIGNLPLGRMGTPEEIANVVVFLCSNQASLVNGASIIVDGGESKAI